MFVYVLVEEYLDKEGNKEVNNLYCSIDKGLIQMKIKAIKEADEYGLFEKYGLRTDHPDCVESHEGSRYVGYYIESVEMLEKIA